MVTDILSNKKIKHFKLSTNPIKLYEKTNKIAEMVNIIIDKELPGFKNNNLLHELVLSKILEKQM